MTVEIDLFELEEEPFDDSTIGALIRAEARHTRNLFRRIMTDIQQHLNADVAAIKAGIDALEAEIAALKVQPGAIGTGIDFSALDAIVAGLKGATAPTTPAAAEPGSAAAPTDAGTAASSGGAAPTGTETPAASAPSAAAPQTLYAFEGTGTPDLTGWTVADVQTPDGKALYTFAGDTAPGDVKGASADWTVYTGPTEPVPAPS